jgi:hypothetical protein
MIIRKTKSIEPLSIVLDPSLCSLIRSLFVFTVVLYSLIAFVRMINGVTPMGAELLSLSSCKRLIADKTIVCFHDGLVSDFYI